MGMSATQARYLNLIARQNDLEFQGQQINQSRTTLSDQTNNLYSQLQNLDVPTPPVTNDYTTLVYSTTDGAVKYTLGMVRPSTKQDGAYNLDLKFTTVGDSLQMANTASSISYADATLQVSEVKPTTSKTGDYEEASINNVTPEFYISTSAQQIKGSEIPDDDDVNDYVMVNGQGYVAPGETIDPNATYVKKTSVEEYNALDSKDGYVGYAEKTITDDIILDEASLGSYYVQLAGGDVVQLSMDSDYVEKTEDGCKINLPAGAKLFEKGGTQTINNPNPGELQIGGNTALSFNEAQAKYKDEIDWNSYEKAIINTFGKDKNNNNPKLEDFYFVITASRSGTYDVKLFPKESIPTTPQAQGMTVKGYTYETGTYTETTNKDYVDIQFDSTGRICKITIPVQEDENGVPTAWKELDVTTKSETDNAAYENAMTQYEYAKYQYDKEQTEINAQMSIIQSQDKKLELKLQRLDNERTQITTEIEALEKVIQDDIESSYKTFSG